MRRRATGGTVAGLGQRMWRVRRIGARRGRPLRRWRPSATGGRAGTIGPAGYAGGEIGWLRYGAPPPLAPATTARHALATESGARHHPGETLRALLYVRDTRRHGGAAGGERREGKRQGRRSGPPNASRRAGNMPRVTLWYKWSAAYITVAKCGSYGGMRAPGLATAKAAKASAKAPRRHFGISLHSP